MKEKLKINPTLLEDLSDAVELWIRVILSGVTIVVLFPIMSEPLIGLIFVILSLWIALPTLIYLRDLRRKKNESK